MTANVGTWDRVVRALVGLGLLVVAALGHGWVRYLGIVGVVLLATALVRFCPAYRLFGMHTNGSAPPVIR
jgi:hypothetical protein